MLRALLRESLAALPAATVLRVDPRDERLAADLLAELGVELEIVGTLETAGGVELTRGDGSRGAQHRRGATRECRARAEAALRREHSSAEAP